MTVPYSYGRNPIRYGVNEGQTRGVEERKELARSKERKLTDTQYS